MGALRHLPERLIAEVQRSGLEPRPRDALTREEVFKERILEGPARIYAISRIDRVDQVELNGVPLGQKTPKYRCVDWNAGVLHARDTAAA